ncbi:MAG: (Fe-S)-binding protein [Actinobacteria bacterium]|nr:(Fe-S)-binding protein [Actinomycetota bacterium]
MHITDHSKTIEEWKNCPMANYVCPVAKYTKLETHTPRGKALMSSLIAYGLKKIDDEVVDRIYQCDLCRACEVKKLDNTSVPDLVLAARRDVVEMNLAPDYVVGLMPQVLSESNIFNEEWLKSIVSQVHSNSDNVVFALTFDSIYAKRSYDALKHISSRAEINLVPFNLGKFPAPASLLNELGYYDDTELALGNLRQLIRACSPRRVVFMTPYDLDLLLKKSSRDELSLLRSSAVHGFTFLSEIIMTEKLSISGNISQPVVYFDFCCPRDSADLYEEPRRILSLIPDSDVREMIWNRKESGSCGGLALPFTFPDLSTGILDSVLSEALESKAKLLVSPCPHCVENLYSSRRTEDSLEIVSLFELIKLTIQ